MHNKKKNNKNNKFVTCRTACLTQAVKKLAHHTTQLVGCNMFCKIYHILIIFKLVAFISLSTLFYFLYFTEIAQKYRDGYTNVIVSQETLDDGIDPPFLTICMAPRTKNLILNNYKLSNGVLNEPNIDEIKFLSSLMCSPSQMRCLEIFNEPRNCCRTWNTLVVVFLNCSCEINFRAPSTQCARRDLNKKS